MSVLASPVPLSNAPQPAPAPPAPQLRPWLFSPTFDLLFVANLGWPLVVLLSLLLSFLMPQTGAFGLNRVGETSDPLSFFQFYILSTAHRWATPFLVFLDREHFWKKPLKFGGLAVLLIGLGLVLVPLSSVYDQKFDMQNPFVLLMMLDYVWNTWHFAAQHAGISRIYGRRVHPDLSQQAAEFEKMAIRLVALWFFFRYALFLGTQSPLLQGSPIAAYIPWLGLLDPLAAAPAVRLLIGEIRSYRPERLGRLLYMMSVVAQYGVLLIFLDIGWDRLLMAGLLSVAIFHATEYLAVVSWSVQRKSAGVCAIWCCVGPDPAGLLCGPGTGELAAGPALSVHLGADHAARLLPSLRLRRHHLEIPPARPEAGCAVGSADPTACRRCPVVSWTVSCPPAPSNAPGTL